MGLDRPRISTSVRVYSSVHSAIHDLIASCRIPRSPIQAICCWLLASWQALRNHAGRGHRLQLLQNSVDIRFHQGLHQTPLLFMQTATSTQRSSSQCGTLSAQIHQCSATHTARLLRMFPSEQQILRPAVLGPSGLPGSAPNNISLK